MKPRYPIYIVSKGRWESRLTSKALEKMGVPYKIVVEPQEVERYREVIDPAIVLELPFSNLGQGSIPARNWIWDRAEDSGAARHWILDDNIGKFYRLYHNRKIPVSGPSPLCATEHFTDRFYNVGLSGLQYDYLVPARHPVAPFVPNTRIYSCILINHQLPFRWRGRYNEDTDLSLRALKSGWCTLLIQAFLAKKISTMVMHGGNTDELYAGAGRLQMAKSLQEQHPDVVTISKRWGRWQHLVDYRPFRGNKLKLRPGVMLPTEPNEYGMKLVELSPGPEQSDGT